MSGINYNTIKKLSSGTAVSLTHQQILAIAAEVDISGKVDKVTGKGLSANDYTDADKTIVAHITTDLSGKVDKVTGYSLVADTEVAKISGFLTQQQIMRMI